MNEEKISFRQFAIAAALSAFSPISRLLPKVPLEMAGKACWIAPLIGYVPVLLIAFGQKKLLEGTKNGMSEVFEITLGKIFGKIVTVIIAVWITMYAGFLLRSGAERLLSTVYKNGRLWFFLATMAVIVLIPALGRVNSISRTAEICIIILTVILAMIFAFAVPEISKDYILPINVLDSGKLLYATVPIINVSTTWIFISFLGGYVNKNSYKASAVAKWVAYVIGFTFLMLVTTIGVLGPELAASQQYPFFIMISNLNILNLLERIEPVIIMLWVLSDFVFISLLLMSSAEAFKNAVNAKNRKIPVISAAAIMLAVGFLVSPDAFKFTGISDKVVPMINLAFSLVALPLMLILKKIRKR